VATATIEVVKKRKDTSKNKPEMVGDLVFSMIMPVVDDGEIRWFDWWIGSIGFIIAGVGYGGQVIL
jgi:hypothetical protein